jgi:N-methylhydantoinase A
MTAPEWLIGVDVGGTFTDAVLLSGGRTWRAKSPSTYPEVGRGVIAACRLAAERAGLALEDLLPKTVRFGLGTTAITNVIATRRGLRVGLITTAGFEEMLRLARARAITVDGWQQPVDSLVDPRAVFGIDERIDRHGEVLKPMDGEAVLAAGRQLAAMGVESIAVSFLWSFVNPIHEDLAVSLLREELPGTIVTGASGLRPVIREYERTTLAVLNAYSFGAYSGIESLADELAQAGLSVPVLLCHSGGGTISIGEAREQPVWLAESGPAAGVSAAALLARESGEARVLTCDLGGTSFDVSHIDERGPARIQRGNLMGMWTALPRVDVESVGAGGGSIAWVDERAMLRIGPASAGSTPGPACYRRGGTEATLTDALLVLGYIDPARFLGGGMVLDRDASVAVCATLGEKLGFDAVETAWGIREIALAEMVKAARARLALNALSAKDFSLVSYGGCGSLFAVDIAANLGAPRVLVSELASVLSAFGAATSEVRRERVRSLLCHLPMDRAELAETLDGLRDEVLADLVHDHVPAAQRCVEFEAEMRFAGQRWEQTISLPAEPARDDGVELDAIFRREYLRRYGAAAKGSSGTVELVALRAIGIGRITAGSPLGRDDTAAPAGQATPQGERLLHLERLAPPQLVDVYDGQSLAAGDVIAGPALIDGADTTIWIPPGASARLDANRTLIAEISA